MTLSRVKDPQAVLDWSYNWGFATPGPGVPYEATVTKWLAEDETIDTATVEITEGPAGDEEDGILQIDSVTNTDSVVTVWVSGGNVGDHYKLTCNIVTNQDRTDERSLTLTIRQR